MTLDPGSVVPPTGAGTWRARVGSVSWAGVRARILDREVIAYAGIFAAALALRLIGLGDKPFHHDESLHAWFSWRLFSGEGYHYDPVYHGPVQYYLTGLMYSLFGVGDVSARLAPALLGSAICVLPALMRRQLGHTAALTASVLLCVTPAFLYFSRFARDDIYMAFLTLALAVAIFRFLDRPSRWLPSVVLGLLALSFATKEATFITVFVFGTFLLAAVVSQVLAARRRGLPVWRTPIPRAVRAAGVEAWGWAAATFLLVFTLVFTTLFTNPQGLAEGLVGGIRYWLSQHSVERGDQPLYYYLVTLPAYQWPVVLLGIVGIVACVRRRRLFDLFLVWWFVLSFLVYSWAGERMPWLGLHPLLPLILLAGVGLASVWSRRSRALRVAAVALLAAGAVYMAYAAIGLSYLRQASPRELLVFVQTSDDVPGVVDQLAALDERVTESTGERLRIQADGWGGTDWPWAWYLRDLSVGYADLSQSPPAPDAEVVLVADPNHEAARPFLEGYTGHRFRLRVWWVPDYGSAGPGDWVGWLLRREPWNETATMDEWLYVRDDLEPLLGDRLPSSP